MLGDFFFLVEWSLSFFLFFVGAKDEENTKVINMYEKDRLKGYFYPPWKEKIALRSAFRSQTRYALSVSMDTVRERERTFNASRDAVDARHYSLRTRLVRYTYKNIVTFFCGKCNHDSTWEPISEDERTKGTYEAVPVIVHITSWDVWLVSYVLASGGVGYLFDNREDWVDECRCFVQIVRRSEIFPYVIAHLNIWDQSRKTASERKFLRLRQRQTNAFSLYCREEHSLIFGHRRWVYGLMLHITYEKWAKRG